MLENQKSAVLQGYLHMRKIVRTIRYLHVIIVFVIIANVFFNVREKLCNRLDDIIIYPIGCIQHPLRPISKIINKVYRVISTIRVHVIANNTLSCRNVCIGADESAELRGVITAV